MATCEVVVWVLVDESGNYVANDQADELGEQFEERVGELKDAGSVRRVKVTLTVPLPKPIEVRGTVSEASEEVADLETE